MENETESISTSFCCFQLTPSFKLFFADIAMLVPSIVFTLFLVYKFRRINEKLTSTRSPMFTTFFAIIYCFAIALVLRCVVLLIMALLKIDFYALAFQISWLLADFCSFFVELTILAFGLFFGNLDLRSSIRKLLIVIFMVSLVYISVESSLQFSLNPQNALLASFLFWIVSALVRFTVYTGLNVLPFTPLRKKLLLPSKRRFYLYCAILALYYAIILIGCTVALSINMSGMCIIAISMLIYFSFYGPFVYLCFLKGYASGTQGTLMFSYKSQKDDTTGSDLPNSLGNNMPDSARSAESSYDEFLFQSGDIGLHSPPFSRNEFWLQQSSKSNSPKNPLYEQYINKQKDAFYGELKLNEDYNEVKVSPDNKEPKIQVKDRNEIV